jgi:hypothetical protein
MHLRNSSLASLIVSSVRNLLVALPIAGAVLPTFAQTVYEEQSKLIRAPKSYTRLGDNLFGDKVNLYTGSLEFIQTDVSLPGNSALPVSVGRRLIVGDFPVDRTLFG